MREKERNSDSLPRACSCGSASVTPQKGEDKEGVGVMCHLTAAHKQTEVQSLL